MVTGKVDKCLSFNGTTDYVSMPVNNNDEISVSAWFYKNSNDTVNNDTIFEGWSWNANSQLEEGFGLRFGSWTPNTIGFIVVTKDQVVLEQKEKLKRI